jgi:hypothetical protein
VNNKAWNTPDVELVCWPIIVPCGLAVNNAAAVEEMETCDAYARSCCLLPLWPGAVFVQR